MHLGQLRELYEVTRDCPEQDSAFMETGKLARPTDRAGTRGGASSPQKVELHSTRVCPVSGKTMGGGAAKAASPRPFAWDRPSTNVPFPLTGLAVAASGLEEDELHPPPQGAARRAQVAAEAGEAQEPEEPDRPPWRSGGVIHLHQSYASSAERPDFA